MTAVEEKKRYLCIYSDHAGVFSIGVFDARSRDEARGLAREKWGHPAASYSIDVFPVEFLPSGWSVYR